MFNTQSTTCIMYNIRGVIRDSSEAITDSGKVIRDSGEMITDSGEVTKDSGEIKHLREGCY